MKQRKRTRHFGLMLMFTVVVFFALLINSIVTSLSVLFLVKTGALYISSAAQPHTGSLILYNTLISITLGFVVSLIAVHCFQHCLPLLHSWIRKYFLRTLR